jgi:hypothetical protein
MTDSLMMGSLLIASVFSYYPAYSLLICTVCPKVLSTHNACRHLHIHVLAHEIISNQWDEQLSQRAISTLAKSLEQIRQVEPVPPLPGLATPKDGLCCTWPSCQTLSMSKDSMARHLSTAHKQPRDSIDHWTRRCLVQSLTLKSYLFEVLPA